MIYIDPSELRESSQLLRYLSDVVYKSLPGLETLTGADVMISPSQCPSPLSDDLVLANITGGAKLIQLKFGHDLSSSIVDGRLNEALHRMMSCGAMHWQCGLLFVGLLGYNAATNSATINNQLTYGDQPMSWSQIDQALGFWVDRWGYLELPLASGKQIKERFENIQIRIDRYTQGEDTRLFWPKLPVFYNEIESDNLALREWNVGQKLVKVDDFRILLCAIPGAKIGPEKATAIMEWMQENEIRLDFNNFLGALRQGWLTQVPGIGPKTIEAIQWGLFRTYEERQEKVSKKND